MATSSLTNTATAAELKAISPDNRTDFKGRFLVRATSVRKAKTGTQFISAELGDKTGSFTFNAFDSAEFYKYLESNPVGAIVDIEGHSDFFAGKFSPRIQKLEPIPEDIVAKDNLAAEFIESSPENPQELWEEYQALTNEIKHEGLRQTVTLVMEEIGDDFRKSSAAITMHHAYRHGLLEHTVHVARAAKALLPLYPEINADLVMTGVLLHDAGKVMEYSTGLTTQKTRIGILQGHVVLGYRLARKAGIQSKLDEDTLERLEHIILSHQGELEWGAAAMAATPEAVFVSMVDNLDAKMGMVQQALRQAQGNDEFSSYLPGLKGPLLVK